MLPQRSQSRAITDWGREGSGSEYQLQHELNITVKVISRCPEHAHVVRRGDHGGLDADNEYYVYFHFIS